MPIFCIVVLWYLRGVTPRTPFQIQREIIHLVPVLFISHILWYYVSCCNLIPAGGDPHSTASMPMLLCTKLLLKPLLSWIVLHNTYNSWSPFIIFPSFMMLGDQTIGLHDISAKSTEGCYNCTKYVCVVHVSVIYCVPMSTFFVMWSPEKQSSHLVTSGDLLHCVLCPFPVCGIVIPACGGDSPNPLSDPIVRWESRPISL
jgi:hypothetical protein